MASTTTTSTSALCCSRRIPTSSSSISSKLLSSATIRRRLPLVGAFCMLSLGFSNLCPALSSSLKTGCAQSLPFVPLLRSKFSTQAQPSSIRMEAGNDTVPSIVVYVTVPNREAENPAMFQQQKLQCVNLLQTLKFCRKICSALVKKELGREQAGSMNSIRNLSHRCRAFSSFSNPSPSLPWISPLLMTKKAPSKPDAPPETLDAVVDSRRKAKFISHETAINLIQCERDPQHALEIFNMVATQKGFNHNHATYSTILHKLAKAKKFDAVDSLVHQMTYETCRFHESVFLDLMKNFFKSSLHGRVLDMFYAIEPIVREKPSLKAMSTCLNLLVEAKQIDLARNFLLHLKKCHDLKPNTCIFNILVKHHCKSGDIESAFEVVEEMKKSNISYPNLVTYSTLMDGLCESGKLKEAMELFERMVSEDQIVPDALTYNILINGFCQWGKVDRASKIMDFMKKNGCKPNVFNYSTLMDGFCKEGRLDEAINAFQVMKSSGLKPDRFCYTTLINYFCRAANIDKAMQLLKEMQEIKCRADIVTFNVILGGLCREGRFEEALGILDKLAHDGVHLNKASYRIVLNFLCQRGELQKALQLLGLMLDRGYVPHHATSNDLLTRFCKAGMIDDAIMVLFGKKLAHSLVKEKLAACVNIVPGIFVSAANIGIESVYQWQGEIQSDSEELLIIKTRQSLLEPLKEHVKANHEYDVPEVISLPITGGSIPYLQWLKNSTRD
ncbi:hypothetical protein Tsubulata_008398 [Turnera subulata]|uniref:Uncharacterized protein n=1 Tax=Turnera subulata TaxID=218843 RepID=A0A9Q0GC32_9ROSI|nr:hypothetical protein Tsubulata_008398 [Turnera subulata]